MLADERHTKYNPAMNILKQILEYPVKRREEHINKCLSRVLPTVITELMDHVGDGPGPRIIPLGPSPIRRNPEQFLDRIGEATLASLGVAGLWGVVNYDAEASQAATKEVHIEPDHLMHTVTQQQLTAVFEQVL
jgi:hypothetical protein